MINLSFTFEVLSFEADLYNKVAARRIIDTYYEGARIFYSTAIRRIPVRTGFVAGAFNNLRDILGGEFGPGADQDPIGLVKRILGPKKKIKGFKAETHREAAIERDVGKEGSESPNRRLTREVDTVVKGQKKKKTIAIKNEFYYPPGVGRAGRILKTPHSGRRFGSKMEEIFVTKKNELSFNFYVDISYFTIQDVANIGRSKSAPWSAMNAGFSAFLKYVQNRIEESKFFPSPLEAVVKYTYKADFRGLTKIRTERVHHEILTFNRRGVVER